MRVARANPERYGPRLMFLARRLVREDEEQLKRFLEANLDTSMILRSNLELTGVQGQGRYSGDYFGSFEQQQLTAVAAHYWNGNLVVQGLSGLDAAVRMAAAEGGRPIRGVLGPAASLKRTLETLNLTHRPTAINSLEWLFTLDMKALHVPKPLADGLWQWRRATPGDRASFLAEWRGDYNVEALHIQDSRDAQGSAGQHNSSHSHGPMGARGRRTAGQHDRLQCRSRRSGAGRRGVDTSTF